jgi:hypothetical protein
MSASEDIYCKVTEVLVESLNVDEGDVTPAATLQGDMRPTRLIRRLSSRCRGGACSASTPPGFRHFPEPVQDLFPHARYNQHARIPRTRFRKRSYVNLEGSILRTSTTTAALLRGRNNIFGFSCWFARSVAAMRGTSVSKALSNESFHRQIARITKRFLHPTRPQKIQMAAVRRKRSKRSPR